MLTETENPKKAYGALKPCASYAPMNVMLPVYRVFELGAKKYGRKNWRKQPVDISTYYNAAQRHLIEFFEQGVDADPESQQSPLAHVIACCMIILDGIERKEIEDDRAFVQVLTGRLSNDEIVNNQIDTSTDDPMLLRQAQPQIQGSTEDLIAHRQHAASWNPRGVPKDF